MRDDDAIRELDGASVLVTSARDQSNPPAGVRGTLEVTPDPDHPGEVAIAVMIETPEMFSTAAHSQRIQLNEKAVEHLLDSDKVGAHTIVVDDLA